jgi:AraC-like DNA-binding protein
MDSRIEAAVGFIHDHFREHLAARQIAHQVGISRSRFEHLFRQQAGSCFKGYVRELRLREAERMLTRSVPPPLKEIAFELGYKYPTNLTRDFRRRFGKPPSRYRAGRDGGSSFC